MNSQKQNLLSKFLEGKLILRGIYLVESPKTVFSAFKTFNNFPANLLANV